MLSKNLVYELSALSLLKNVPDNSVKLQIFDPPYGIKYEAGSDVGNAGQPRKAKRKFVNDDIIDTAFLKVAYDKLTDDGACYLFTGWQVADVWRDAMLEAGYLVHQLIIWDKLHWGQGNLNYFGNQVEFILFASKNGKHRLNWEKRQGNIWRLTKLDVINFEGNADHPTQKPVRLITKIIQLSSNPGDTVMDVHCGSGTVPIAAKATGRDFYATDIDPEMAELSRKRLSDTIQLSGGWMDE